EAGGSGSSEGWQAANLTFSHLAMVEEAVCARAKVFVGTKESSMTGTIVQERLAHQLPPGDSYCFFRRPGFEQRPISVPEYYVINNRTATRGSDLWRTRLEEKGLEGGRQDNGGRGAVQQSVSAVV
ncbi:hypothetical protein Agub_g14733, partial [Astrephomene gubernaculifera]